MHVRTEISSKTFFCLNSISSTNNFSDSLFLKTFLYCNVGFYIRTYYIVVHDYPIFEEYLFVISFLSYICQDTLTSEQLCQDFC